MESKNKDLRHKLKIFFKIYTAPPKKQKQIKKPLKNLAAAPENVEKPSKNCQKKHFFGTLWPEKPPEGGRAPLVAFRGQNAPKKCLRSGRRVLLRVFGRFFNIFGGRGRVF